MTGAWRSSRMFLFKQTTCGPVGGITSFFCVSSTRRPLHPAPGPPQTTLPKFSKCFESLTLAFQPKNGCPIIPATGTPSTATPSKTVTAGLSPFAYSFVPSKGSTYTFTLEMSISPDAIAGGHFASKTSFKISLST